MKYRLEACGVAGIIVAHMCRDTIQATMVQGIIKYGLIRIRIRIRIRMYQVSRDDEHIVNLNSSTVADRKSSLPFD